MLQRALIKSDKTVFLQKKLLPKWLDNVYSCTRNASLEYDLLINYLLSFTFLLDFISIKSKNLQ